MGSSKKKFLPFPPYNSEAIRLNFLSCPPCPLKYVFVTSQLGEKSNKRREKCDGKPSATFDTRQLWDNFTGRYRESSLQSRRHAPLRLFSMSRLVNTHSHTDTKQTVSVKQPDRQNPRSEIPLTLFCSLLDFFFFKDQNIVSVEGSETIQTSLTADK